MSVKRPFDTHIILLMICMINIVNPNAVSGNLLVFYRHKCDCFLVCKCNHILVPDGIRADSLQHAIRNKSICLNGNASVCILSYLKCRIFQFQIFDWNNVSNSFLETFCPFCSYSYSTTKNTLSSRPAINSLYSFSNRHSALSAGTSFGYFLLLDHLEVQCFHRDFRFYPYQVKCLVLKSRSPCEFLFSQCFLPHCHRSLLPYNGGPCIFRNSPYWTRTQPASYH